MPSNDERREVAENLRNMMACGCRYAEQFYELLQETVMRTEDFHSFDDVANRLADLIEPEERTCRMELCDTGEEFMPECREEYLMCEHCKFVGYYVQVNESADYWCAKPNYCPECGARVKEEA